MKMKYRKQTQENSFWKMVESHSIFYIEVYSLISPKLASSFRTLDSGHFAEIIKKICHIWKNNEELECLYLWRYKVSKDKNSYDNENMVVKFQAETSCL